MSALVELYTTSFCTPCDLARQQLERAGISFRELDLSLDPDRCCSLAALTGGRSAPQIVIDGRAIGGLDELRALLNSLESGGLSSRS